MEAVQERLFKDKEHPVRVVMLFAAGFVVFLVARALLVPKDFALPRWGSGGQPEPADRLRRPARLYLRTLEPALAHRGWVLAGAAALFVDEVRERRHRRKLEGEAAQA